MIVSNTENGEKSQSATTHESLMLDGRPAFFNSRSSMAGVRSTDGLDVGKMIDAQITTSRYGELLHNTVVLPRHAFHDNLIAPTPADPFNIIDSAGVDYFSDSRDMMLERLRVEAERTGIDDVAHHAIMDELETQHRLQSNKNSENYLKFCDALSLGNYLLNDDMRAMITRLRSGEATSAERMILMSLFPELEAVEDMKFTKALDTPAIERAVTVYVANLIRLSNHSQHIEFKLLPKSRQPARFSYSDNDGHIVVGKAVIAEASVLGKELEFVARSAYYLFPEADRLSGMSNKLVTLPDGTMVNQQQISESVYIRLKSGTPSIPERKSAKSSAQPELSDILSLASMSFKKALGHN